MQAIVTGQGQMTLLGKLIWMVLVKYQAGLKIWLHLVIQLVLYPGEIPNAGKVN